MKPHKTLQCDLLVLGSGAGGLSAAVTAAHLGLRVIVAEKDPKIGGTTAWSGGWMWVPRNPLARAAGIEEDLEQPLNYLRHELGERFDETMVRRYLTAAPRMVAFFQQHTALQFIDGNAIPDFHGHTPDAGLGGRSVCAAPFDGSKLGTHAAYLKPPLLENTFWGLGIASGAELRHYLQATRSLTSFLYVTRRLLGYALDRVIYGRATRLVNGHALAGALLASARKLGVHFELSAPAVALRQEEGRVCGADLQTPHGLIRVAASSGVVLATGGFPHDARRKRALLTHAPTGEEHKSAASWGNTGDGLRLGESVGAVVAQDLRAAAALAPVSRYTRPDGQVVHFPHLIDRAKPGLIAVTPEGKRFCNEADSYHDFTQALLRATPRERVARAWLIADHAFVRRYGLGVAKPAPLSLTPYVRQGYLRRGNSLAELARACDIPPEALAQTVLRYNAMAERGVDDDFAKGQTPYNRIQGDATRDLPNPCMAPIARGPFYAVAIEQGSLGTFAGLRVNPEGQALDARGQAIAGLYASGNEMASIMAGHYPSGGITLGPAMTFGFLAAQHAAGQDVSLQP